MAVGRYLSVKLSLRILPIAFVVWMLLLNNRICLCNEYFHTVAASDFVVLQCCCGTGLNNKWKFEGVFIYFNRVEVDGRFGNTTSLSRNYSLMINHVLIKHEGVYECIRDSTVLYRHTLVVEVPPELFTTTNGIKDVSEIFLEDNEDVHLICYAIHAKPAVNLSWVVSNGVRSPLEVNHSITINRENRNTFDSKSEYRGLLPHDKGNITCTSRGQSVHSGLRVHMRYFRYASPVMLLVINGQTCRDEVHLPRENEILVTCNVFRSSFSPKIFWLINSIPVESKNASISPNTNNSTNLPTFDVTSSLEYVPKEQNGTITCAAFFETVNINKSAEIRFYTHASPIMQMFVNGLRVNQIVFVEPNQHVEAYCYAKNSDFIFNLSWVVNGKDINSLEGKIRTEIWNESEGAERSVHSTLWFLPESKNGNLTCISKGGYLGETSINAYYQTKDINKNTGKAERQHVYPYFLTIALLVLLLPSVGYCLYKKILNKNCSSAKSVSIQRYVARQSSVQLKGVSTHDVQQVNERSSHPPRMELPDLPDCAKPPEQYSNVAAIEEAVLLKKEIHWEAFVRRVMEVPENTNLVKVEGICIDATHLYLLHEHLVCQKLDTSLNSTKTVDNNELFHFMTEKDVMKHTLGILEGLEIIHSYGFLHPGLSTKKIVITKHGTCKLYDFCLKDDASHVLAVKKSHESISVSTIAPECVLRNEYFPASDVWSTAVVIWELMSGGLPPFCGQDLIPKEQTSKLEVPHVWPEQYRQFRNDRMFHCWQQDLSLRPTIHELRFTFKEIFDSLVEEDLSKASSTSVTDLYMPMKEPLKDNSSYKGLKEDIKFQRSEISLQQSVEKSSHDASDGLCVT